MKKIWTSFIAPLVVSVAFLLPAVTYATPPSFIAPNEVMRGNFSQDRFLAGFDAPLHSNGNFTLAPNQGLIWRSEKPFATTVIITSQGLIQKTGDTELMRLSATEMPYFAPLYRFLAATLSGDWGALSEHYQVRDTAVDNGRELTLHPLKGNAGLVPFDSITIHYSKFVDHIEIRKPDGDRDHLSFTDVMLSSGPVGAAEEALYDDANQ